MRKSLIALCVALLVFGLTGCDGEQAHTIIYEKAEKTELLNQFNCVAVYTQYTNGSEDSAVPADWISVKAYQKGVELAPIVPTGDVTNGYVQCDASVQSGVTANVIWFFELDDEVSTVSLEMAGSDAIEIPISEE